MVNSCVAVGLEAVVSSEYVIPRVSALQIHRQKET